VRNQGKAYQNHVLELVKQIGDDRDFGFEGRAG